MSSLTKAIRIGDVLIGGGNPVAVQTMSTLRLKETEKAIESCRRLKSVGCDVIRFSVVDEEDARAIKTVKENIDIPLVADIHFDYSLAIKSLENGADKIRINPGNIGGEDKVKKVAEALKFYNKPVRVGSNTGSIEKEFLEKYGRSAVALAESALKSVASLEKYGVSDVVVSVKASDVKTTTEAYKYVSARTDYPLHVGVTEAGTEYNGVVKNSIGIGSLLLNGIGDTIRVSLSADPEREVVAGRAILSALGLLDCVDVVACPTCGRCEWDCMRFASEVQSYVANVKKKLKIAVMGCVVNGPGEGKEADLGIAGGKDCCLIFSQGEILKKVPKDRAKEEFFREIDKCIR